MYLSLASRLIRTWGLTSGNRGHQKVKTEQLGALGSSQMALLLEVEETFYPAPCFLISGTLPLISIKSNLWLFSMAVTPVCVCRMDVKQMPATTIA